MVAQAQCPIWHTQQSLSLTRITRIRNTVTSTKPDKPTFRAELLVHENTFPGEEYPRVFSLEIDRV